jgi:hypothetical protein
MRAAPVVVSTAGLAPDGGRPMNIFRSDAAPYFFVLVASAIGWFATGIANEMNSRRIAVYAIEPADRGVRLLIENISRTSTISDARFLFVCRDGRVDCFEAGPQGEAGPPRYEITATPPLYLADMIPDGTGESLELTVTLVPSSALDITLFPLDPASADVVFYYVPEGDVPQDILFLAAGGPVPWFLRNYFPILIVAFGAALALLGVLITINLVTFVLSLFKQEAPPDGPDRHHVTLRLDGGDEP